MLELAQDLWKVFQPRFCGMIHNIREWAEALGVPRPFTALLYRLECLAQTRNQETGSLQFYSAPNPGASSPFLEKSIPSSSPVSSDEGNSSQSQFAPAPTTIERKKPSNKRRIVGAPANLSNKVRPLKPDDAIDGSTYLARIVWSLGVAELEGLGALRPADIARLIMSRSPVSLEPPNVARYIRRNKPTSIRIDHIEGSSNFYTLNEEGRALFKDKFRLKGSN